MKDRLQIFNTPIKSFNIEATNWCYLKCSACDRTIRKSHVKNRNDLSYKVFEKFIMEDLKDIDLSSTAFNFCGIYGDNLYHPDIIQIFNLLKSRGSRVVLETNGSYKDDEFWIELLNTLTPQDSINFSVDGLEDTNSIYRKGSSWKHIYRAMELAGSSQVGTQWKFIVFKHNQHQIKEAEELAKKLNIKKFLLRYSGRFIENDPLLPDPEYVGLQQKHWNAVKNAAVNNNLDREIKILPRCLTGKNIGITNEGLVIPCLTFHSIKNKWMEDNRSKLSLHNRSFLDIINDSIWDELEQLWNTPSNAPFVCSKYCGVPKEEFNKLTYNRIKKADYNHR